MSQGAGANPGDIDRDKLLRLPREVRVRIRDIPRHLRAFRLALSRTSEERLVDAMRSGDEEVLLAEVYPIERPLELLDNYIGELTMIGLEDAGEPLGSGVENLRRLAELGGVATSRAERLIEVHRTRNDLEHQYPDVAAAGIFEAAGILSKDISPFLSEYLRWFLDRID